MPGLLSMEKMTDQVVEEDEQEEEEEVKSRS